MQIEVGKTYRTRSGRIVEIITQLRTDDTDPFIGIITNEEGMQQLSTYTLDGRWDANTREERRMDIIGPVEPEPKCERCGK